MKKLIALLLMLTLIVSLVCTVAAETAPDDSDTPVDNSPSDGAEDGTANDSVEDGSNGETTEGDTEKDENATDTKGESQFGGADEPTDQDFSFNPSAFAENLEYMGVGMVGIFLVIGIIIVSTILLNRIFSGKSKEN